MSNIILTTLNARYAHSAIGLRYLYANLGELQQCTEIREFTINDAVQDIAEKLLESRPAIIGVGIYIWNAEQSRQLMEIIKKVSPDTILIIGGPEAGNLPQRIDFSAADYTIRGEGDLAFAQLCRELLAGRQPESCTIQAPIVDLNRIALPYEYYTQHDIEHRQIYVEASRGCPFLCEFCLSSSDKSVRQFDTDRLLNAFESLWQRGARSFKFIDRTFNLNMQVANQLLDFFLNRDEPCFVHFEVIPDHFPDSVRQRIARFPAAMLQLEVGIQTLNPEVAKTVRRNLKLEKIEENIRFLEQQSAAHMHLDLIVGLPGESLESFGNGLNRLVSWTSSEIQIGILKKLSGTTMGRHDDPFGMCFSDSPPYEIVQNSTLSFAEIQHMRRFSRFWDIYYNSGNFKRSLPLLWTQGDCFAAFSAFTSWIYEQTQATWKISLDRQAELLFNYLREQHVIEAEPLAAIMQNDLLKIEGRYLPAFLKPFIHGRKPHSDQNRNKLGNKRQLRHL